MNAGRTVMMDFPDGTSKPIPADSASISIARKYGGQIQRRPTSSMGRPMPSMDVAGAVQGVGGMAQRAVNATPDVMGGVGGFMGLTAPQRAASATRLGIAGRAISHDINALTGAEQSWTPQQAVHELGAEGARQGAMAYTGEGIAKAGKSIAEPLMKSALGRSTIGSAKRALKAGLRPTEEFLAKTTAKIAAAKERAVGLAQQLETAGRTSSYGDLVAPIKKALSRFSRHDVTGNETERALQDVLGEMTNKIGPVTTKNPAGKILDVGGQPMIGASKTTVPAQPITPTQLQEINQIAGQKLKDLFAAKQGKLGVPPDPRELGYMKVWARSKQLLEGMGPEGREISRLNKEMQNQYRLHALASNAGMRAHTLTPSSMFPEAIAAGGAAVAGHNPLLALSALPMSLLRHIATSPDALAREASFFNSPAFAAGSRVVPRIPIALYNQLNNEGR